jgi:hypothetical protein
MSRPTLTNPCKGKVAYNSRRDAVIAIKSCTWRLEPGKPYKCPICKLYHTGHVLPKRVVRAIKRKWRYQGERAG